MECVNSGCISTDEKIVYLQKISKKAAPNDPKYFYCHLYGGGFFILMVADPIQDMSEVSIAHKTVDVSLPRLRCGAIAEQRWKPKTEAYGPAERSRTV
jgi:hypothetical protein